MRKNASLYICGTLLSAIMLSGCDAYESVQRLFVKKDTVKRESVLPTDRESIDGDQYSKLYTPEELRKGVVKGDWAIEEVNGHEAIWENAPFLRFESVQKRVYGNNGCNTINANYNYNAADSTISFSNMAQTMMLCNKAGITDMEINLALAATHYYSWEIKDSQYYLYFYDRVRNKVMTLLHQNFQFLNGTWHVSSINDEPVDDPEIKIVIDVDEGKLHGFTGCNTINGTMEIDMNTANSISFQAFAITRKACGEDSFETQLLVALEEADHARPLSKDKVALINSQGVTILLLERASDK